MSTWHLMVAQVGATVPQSVLTLFDVIGVLGTVASLVLSFVAMWLAASHKRDADKVNAETASLLADIRAETRAISKGVMDELRAYGESMRGTYTANRMNTPSSVTAQTPPDMQYSGQEHRSLTPGDGSSPHQ